jgi:hypothetical protein
MNDSKNYGQILLYSFLGGLGGAIPFLASKFLSLLQMQSSLSIGRVFSLLALSLFRGP